MDALSAAPSTIGPVPEARVASETRTTGPHDDLSALRIADDAPLIYPRDIIRQSDAHATDAREVDAPEQHVPAGVPVFATRVSSAYASHRWHPILGRDMPHYGVDLAAVSGSPIRAPAAGIVVGAAWTPTYGLVIDIDHGNDIITRYAHASRLLVSVGDHVDRGALIALVGQSGRTTGPHLHYEVFLHRRSVDPDRYLFGRATASVTVAATHADQ